jgi:stearoyl-CoA desaturase (delta-9 desaturase)
LAGTDLGLAPRARIYWRNTVFLVVAHVLAAGAVVYLVRVRLDPWTLALGGLWWLLCSLSISAGYHRLFSHRTYQAHPAVETLYLLFGAASVQGSALGWSYDHRQHHAHTDTDRDPHDARRGFWWTHVGWLLFDSREPRRPERTRDLTANPRVRFQDRHYILLATLVGAVLPFVLGWLWGDPLGAFLVAGPLRLVIQWQATFSVNSLAHKIGRRPYRADVSARDSWITALVTMGEGYHNYHHAFPADYRNGVRWYQPDPSKWLVWGLSRVGLTRGLRRTTSAQIERARRTVRDAS